MANRHKTQKAKGKNVGGAAVAGGNPKVFEEAKKKATGGAVAGFKSGGRLDKRARGGAIGTKDWSKDPFSAAHRK